MPVSLFLKQNLWVILCYCLIKVEPFHTRWIPALNGNMTSFLGLFAVSNSFFTANMISMSLIRLCCERSDHFGEIHSSCLIIVQPIQMRWMLASLSKMTASRAFFFCKNKFACWLHSYFSWKQNDSSITGSYFTWYLFDSISARSSAHVFSLHWISL